MTSTTIRQQYHHRRQLDTSLERQARLAAANAVANSLPKTLPRQRSISLTSNVDRTHWLLVMPTAFEVMYRLVFCFSFAIYR